MLKKALLAAGLAAAFVLVPTAAQALDCYNPNKPPADCGAVCTDGPVVQGNWVWLPSVFPGAPEEWVFVPPGTVELTPGAKGNFQNGEGYALLVNAICDSHGSVLEKRQNQNGIQLLEGCSAEH
ncbi:hypothetical protein [Agromyces sp. H66]|uniref:hypothetical protein n=1 Tax=Agromyces sp. H66 TaxID=2529859 RepID=UPI0010A9A4E2|nr:hypothetical protein [Agromyces sp. H66]